MATTTVINPTTFHTPKQIRSATIAFDNTGIGTLVGCGLLAIGEIVDAVWAEITTAWNSGTSDTLTVGIADEDGTTPVPLATFNAQTASTVSADNVVSTAPASLGTVKGRAVTAGEVYAKVVSVGTAVTAGVATIFYSVSTPDSAGVTYSATPTQTVGTGETAGYVA